MNRVHRDRGHLRSPSGSRAEGELVPGLWTFQGFRPGLDTSHLTQQRAGARPSLGQRCEVRAKGAPSTQGTLHWPRKPDLPQATAPTSVASSFQQKATKALLLPPN